MAHFIYNGEEFDYTIVRKRKKNISITIKKTGEVIVASPYNVTEEYLNALVKEKALWIIEKLNKIKRDTDLADNKKYENGDTLNLLGVEYPIKIVETDGEAKVSAEFTNNIFKVSLKSGIDNFEKRDVIREALIKLMKEIALEVFNKRTKYYGEKIKLYPEKICIKGQKSLWGSCSTNNNINYNWKLIMAPIDVLDYIVVHELCHIKYKNHSKEYWNFVESIIPDWKDKRIWLKENGGRLEI